MLWHLETDSGRLSLFLSRYLIAVCLLYIHIVHPDTLRASGKQNHSLGVLRSPFLFVTSYFFPGLVWDYLQGG